MVEAMKIYFIVSIRLKLLLHPSEIRCGDLISSFTFTFMRARIKVMPTTLGQRITERATSSVDDNVYSACRRCALIRFVLQDEN